MLIRLAAALSFLATALSQPALAQYLYKSTMPDGKVIYGDGPMPGAVKVEKTKPDTSKKGISGATPQEAAALKKLEAERASASGQAGTGETYTMEETLKKLEAQREAAREPLAGERIGTAGGKSRLTDAYWERQKRMDQDIEMLKREIEKARAGK
jgi:hypothetical protein